ncbi:MAG: hypothetical protein Q8S73_26595 [Deltaproteobacteria bacterium]|nr:hypothetical protein [Myxococcales bacterium]MDP3217705.1 hypothetical protein [Deltaproteobacteria bacterium]
MDALATERVRLRFAHKVERVWSTIPHPAPMPRYWRAVCDAALDLRPHDGGDLDLHRAVAMAILFTDGRLCDGRKGEVVARGLRRGRGPNDLSAVARLAVRLVPVARRYAGVWDAR